MIKKESLYINAIKYDTQLKLDYKKIDQNDIIKNENSLFLVNEDILPFDIVQKINSSQEEIPQTYISTLLLSDTTKLVQKDKSSKLQDCDIADFNSKYDLAVLKTTLFETKNFFAKTGIDYVYSAFHIMNEHLNKNSSKNELLIFLFNNKAYLLINDKNGEIVYHKTEDMPSFESIKKSHFYEDDIAGQKLFDEVYYFELIEIIQKNLNAFYKSGNQDFLESINILYLIKQLNPKQLQSIEDEFLLKVSSHPINIDEEIFALSRNQNRDKSFISPRKKKKKADYTNLIIFLILLLFSFGAYKVYETIMDKNINTLQSEKESAYKRLPNHLQHNNIIKDRIKSILNAIPYDVVLKNILLNKDSMRLEGTLLEEGRLLTSLKPNLEKLYDSTKAEILTKEKKINIDFRLVSKDVKKTDTIKLANPKYITDEFIPISRVTEQLKILLPTDTIIKFKSSSNKEITKYFYTINTLVKSPKEFFELIDTINQELYSISILYPISMTKTVEGIEVEFTLDFNQLR